jgi:hypothetical protein
MFTRKTMERIDHTVAVHINKNWNKEVMVSLILVVTTSSSLHLSSACFYGIIAPKMCKWYLFIVIAVVKEYVRYLGKFWSKTLWQNVLVHLPILVFIPVWCSQKKQPSKVVLMHLLKGISVELNRLQSGPWELYPHPAQQSLFFNLSAPCFKLSSHVGRQHFIVATELNF